MSVAPLENNSETKSEKNFRRINYCGLVNPPSVSSTHCKVMPNFSGGSGVQKVGGGGYISSACRKAPRPQSLLPSLPLPSSLTSSGTQFKIPQSKKLANNYHSSSYITKKLVLDLRKNELVLILRWNIALIY